MRAGEIAHVNVIADRRTIRSRIVPAEHRHGRPAA
jgi:hypothetical protein